MATMLNAVYIAASITKNYLANIYAKHFSCEQVRWPLRWQISMVI